MKFSDSDESIHFTNYTTFVERTESGASIPQKGKYFLVPDFGGMQIKLGRKSLFSIMFGVISLSVKFIYVS